MVLKTHFAGSQDSLLKQRSVKILFTMELGNICIEDIQAGIFNMLMN